MSPAPLAVVVPTRDRAARLAVCLEHLAAARGDLDFPVYVVDASSTPATRAETAEACSRFDFVRLHHHNGQGVAAARNECARVADADLIVNVDDDVYVEPPAIQRLLERHASGSGWRVTAGSVAWGDSWSQPRVTRRIGYGRSARPGEEPHFVVGAFFLFPRALALACPWIESIPTADDRTIGSLWRTKGVAMLFEPDARARHDAVHHVYGVAELRDHFYAALFDAMIANPSVIQAVTVEAFGLPAGVKRFVRSFGSARALLRSWADAHVKLFRDRRYLRARVAEPLPAPPPSLDHVPTLGGLS